MLIRSLWMLVFGYDMDLVKETQDLPRYMFTSRLIVIHNAGRGGKDYVPELTRGQQLDHPLLQIAKADVESRANDAGLVQAGQRSD